jgi:hypothetical protein
MATPITEHVKEVLQDALEEYFKNSFTDEDIFYYKEAYADAWDEYSNLDELVEVWLSEEYETFAMEYYTPYDVVEALLELTDNDRTNGAVDLDDIEFKFKVASYYWFVENAKKYIFDTILDKDTLLWMLRNKLFDKFNDNELYWIYKWLLVVDTSVDDMVVIDITNGFIQFYDTGKDVFYELEFIYDDNGYVKELIEKSRWLDITLDIAKSIGFDNELWNSELTYTSEDLNM